MKKIRELLIRIPIWMEVAIVMLICFGLSISGSAISMASGDAFTQVSFTNEVAVQILIAEIIFSSICITFLYLRGYKIWKELRLSPSIKGSIGALALFVGTYIAYAVFFNIVYLLAGSENLTIAQYTISVAWPLVLAVSLINPLFEETFVVGYLFDRFRGHSIVLLILASTLIRVSYHLYQGWIGIISILPLGLLFAIVYWKTENLWSLYLSHVLMDFIGLMSQPS